MINKEGVFSVAAKVDGIKDTPILKDVTQLRDFLPDAAAILELLHEERKGVEIESRATGSV